ncbi:hypothetical protein TeGR_g4160, partial [Tetraparma gracilis]
GAGAKGGGKVGSDGGNTGLLDRPGAGRPGGTGFEGGSTPVRPEGGEGREVKLASDEDVERMKKLFGGGGGDGGE